MKSEDWVYCQTVLPKVSRTFALNIQVLKGDLHRAVLIAYLWCRIIDTVEDAPKFPAEQKVDALRTFAHLYDRDHLDPLAFTNWSHALQAVDGASSELDLLSNSHRVARCHSQLSHAMRDAMRKPVVTMARGMAQYQLRGELGRTELLKDEADLDRYCYYVAGTVGELLTNLFLLNPSISSKKTQVIRANAVSFGLGLQLTNISKDVMADQKRGWCYIPKTFIEDSGVAAHDFLTSNDPIRARLVLDSMIHKATKHLDEGLEYTLNLPKTWRTIRLFCIWPLFMAYETLRLLAQPEFVHQSHRVPKISRQQVKRIVQRSSLCFWSNAWLLRQRRGLDLEITSQKESP